jgi:hypothetical protein
VDGTAELVNLTLTDETGRDGIIPQEGLKVWLRKQESIIGSMVLQLMMQKQAKSSGTRTKPLPLQMILMNMSIDQLTDMRKPECGSSSETKLTLMPDPDGQGTDFPPLVVCARRRGKEGLQHDHQRKDQGSRSDRTGEPPQGRGMEERGEGGMITQTEIICLAIRALDAEIETWRTKCAKGGEEGQRIFESMTAGARMKRETLCTLYLIQTGTNYN